MLDVKAKDDAARRRRRRRGERERRVFAFIGVFDKQ